MPSIRVESIIQSGQAILGDVPENFFGGIVSNFFGWENYQTQHNYLSLQLVRFPGGTFSETGRFVGNQLRLESNPLTFAELISDRSQIAFDITFPELINPQALLRDDRIGTTNEIASFSDILQFAIQNDSPASVIIPTRRYLAGVDIQDTNAVKLSLELAQADVSIFLERLTERQFNEGRLPDRIILELGNENYDDPIGYALVARAMMDQIVREIGSNQPGIEIAVQMGTGSLQYARLAAEGYFSEYFNSNGSPRISALDGVFFDPNKNLSLEEKTIAIDGIMQSILGPRVTEVDLLRHHYLSAELSSILDTKSNLNQRPDIYENWLARIETQGGDASQVGYFVSAWSVGSESSRNLAFTPQAAVNALALLAYFVSHGVDLTANWGIVAAQQYSLDLQPEAVTSVKDGNLISPHGELLHLMAESVTGMSLVETSHVQELVPDRFDDYLQYMFEGDEQLVIFIGVGDLGGFTLDLTLDLDGFELFTGAEATHIEVLNGHIAGPGIIEQSKLVVMDNEVMISFDEDYEIVRVVLDKPILNTVQAIRGLETFGSIADDRILGTKDDDTMHGLAGNDVLRGADGANILFGDSGNDRLHGGPNDDNLFGGLGDDILRDTKGNNHANGGEGNDWILLLSGDNSLMGGSGNDILLSGWGDDTIFGDSGNDVLDGDSNLAVLFGNDTLSGGSGDDYLRGGRGTDVFAFTINDGRDQISDFDVNYAVSTERAVEVRGRDFEIGVDLVRLTGFTGITGSNVLTYLHDSQGDAVFQARGTEIVFVGVQVSSLSASDFIFS